MDRCVYIYIYITWSEIQKVELSQTDEKPEYKVEEIKVFAMLQHFSHSLPSKSDPPVNGPYLF
jgi:hypothetical protein